MKLLRFSSNKSWELQKWQSFRMKVLVLVSGLLSISNYGSWRFSFINIDGTWLITTTAPDTHWDSSILRTPHLCNCQLLIVQFLLKEKLVLTILHGDFAIFTVPNILSQMKRTCIWVENIDRNPWLSPDIPIHRHSHLRNSNYCNRRFLRIFKDGKDKCQCYWYWQQPWH